MGINTRNNVANAINLGYSAFLGMMYVQTDRNEELIQQAKNLVGDDEVKKGFTGARAGSTGKARAFLKENGVEPVDISGKLAHAQLRHTEKDGRSYDYVNVCVKDNDGLYCLSLSADQEAAELLTRKLVNAKFGEETSISVYAMMEKSDNPQYPDRMFARHIASVKQGGEEVTGVSPAPIKGMADEAVTKLKESGLDNPDVIKATRKNMAQRFHTALWEDIHQAVATYKAARNEEAPSGASSEPAMAGADNDRPF